MRCLSSLLVLVISLTAVAASGAEPILTAGFSERDISPEVGMERPGGYRKLFHDRFHDSCKVRIAVFDDGRKAVVLVGLDTFAVPRSIVLAARAEIHKRTGIPGEAVLIAASHSHSSGPLAMILPGQFDNASEDIRHLAYEESSMADAGYMARVTEEIIAGVVAAHASRVPAQLGFGFGHDDKVAFNRRQRMKNGQTWSHAGAMNPDIVDYAGPIDPQVGVVGAWDSSGTLLGSIVTFACHATTNPNGISANWIYYLEKTIQGALETRTPVVFFAGPSGDVTQIDNLNPFRNRVGSEWARFVGGRIGAEAVKVLLTAPRAGDLPIDVRQKTWSIRRRPPAPETIAHARATIEKGKRPSDLTDWLFAKETLLLSHLIAQEPAADVEVQALQVGPAVFVSNPAEYFVAYGLEIKQRSAHAFTFPIELANGYVGYVPTEEAFGPNGGGYETRLTFYSNLETSAGRQFAETGVALANEMRRIPPPEFPRIKAPGTPWTYGNVSPGLK